jgi:hypothetical protein
MNKAACRAKVWVFEGRYLLPHDVFSVEIGSFAPLEVQEPVARRHHVHLCTLREASPALLKDAHPLGRRQGAHPAPFSPRASPRSRSEDGEPARPVHAQLLKHVPTDASRSQPHPAQRKHFAVT